MGRNAALNEQHKQETRQKILETALRVFSEKTIDAVNMTEIAEAAGIGTMTMYRHFDKKPDLVLAVSAWAWDQYYRQSTTIRADITDLKASDAFEAYLDAFIDLYQNHRDILRFNQYFNAYVKREGIPQERMKPFAEVIRAVATRFHKNYLLAEEDGTLRTDIPEQEIFSATLHLMLAAVTRYAVGLVYDANIDPIQELYLLKKMLMREYTVQK